MDHIIPHARNNFHPHLLAHRTLGLFAIFVCILKITVLLTAAVGPTFSAQAAPITIDNIVNLTNTARSNAHVLQLQTNSLLNSAAQAKAENMLENSYFAHVSPAGLTPWYWFAKAGYTYQAAGENLAVNFSEDYAVVDAWLASPGHKANLLNPAFTQIGIGIATGPFEGRLATFVVQMFGLPATSTTPAKAANEPKPDTVALNQPVQKIQPKIATATTPKTTNSSATKNSLIELAIADLSIKPQTDLISVNVKFNTPPTQAWVEFAGKESKLEKTNNDDWWKTQLSYANNASGTVMVKALSQTGKTLEQAVLEVDINHKSALGLPNLNPKIAEAEDNLGPAWKFLQDSEPVVYPVLIAVILTALVVTIAVHRHMQNIRLIANTSFVVSLISVLWII